MFSLYIDPLLSNGQRKPREFRENLSEKAYHRPNPKTTLSQAALSQIKIQATQKWVIGIWHISKKSYPRFIG